mmetsp:Transcript_6308/g.21135  ORF Transcript_6308/g.21135 Transcript_6308/m.21135 type:complete len:633 (-) Transcript_6308:117-2015(-)
MARSSVRIGCSSGFWGDTPTAAAQLLTRSAPPLDYLVADYLAEVTMGLLAGAALKGTGGGGFVKEFLTEVFVPLLPRLADGRTRVVTNAGGLDPRGLKEALEKAAAEAGFPGLVVAAVTGDNLSKRWGDVCASAKDFSCAPGDSPDSIPENLLSANAYLGAAPIVAALADGAHIVVTGRCADSALVLAPLAHEFGWSFADYDLMAAGTVCGHILECGAQCSGGNSTDWREAIAGGGWADGGFPVADCFSDGSFVVSKPSGTGGVVSRFTVAEQLLYEIGDPAAYLCPDVICDVTQVAISELADGRGVLVTGARGRPPTGTYKVSLTSRNGFWVGASAVIGGADAAAKAHAVANAVVTRAQRLLNEAGLAPYSEVQIDALGAEATYGPFATQSARNTREVVLRVAARHKEKRALEILSKEMTSASTGMAPGIMGAIAGGRARTIPLIAHAACLVDPAILAPEVHVGSQAPKRVPAVAAPNAAPALVPIAAKAASGGAASSSAAPPAPLAARPSGGYVQVPLSAVAVARSGDKGDAANIGVIARSSELFPYIKAALPASAVRHRFAHCLAADGEAHRYELEGVCALNFLLTKALGGGGINSLRVDRQGKAYAQQLLTLEVAIPRELLPANRSAL